MAITLRDVSVKLVKIPINGVSVPLFAVYADFTGIETDHNFVITADIFTAIRAMWATYPAVITLQRRGYAQNALTDLVNVTKTENGMTVTGAFTDNTSRYYNVDYYAAGSSRYHIFGTGPGYTLASDNRQRISTGILFIDNTTGKAVVYSMQNNRLSSETIPATQANPNPNGATLYNGLPISLAPTSWAYATPTDVTATASSPYLVDVRGVEPYASVDPYEPGGDTGDDDTPGQGGTGDFDGDTDPIDFPDLPTVSAVDTKFITIFNPSKAQLTSLAEYMWSPLFDLDTLKKLWADPMDCILGLTMVPFSVPNGGAGTVSIGNVSTGISMTKAGSQYVSIDCGSINVKEFWGGYLDYDPYTKFQIYLPYVGIKPLLADEIMGKSIHVKYHCDILTGACNCFVKCGGSVLYSFNGQCSTQIPISGNDWRNTISAAVNIAGQAAGMYMTGGATAPMAIASIAQSAVNGLKQTVEKSGSLSGTGGMLAIQKPYLIVTRPRQAVPKNQQQFTGYPTFITRTLSSCSGYTEVYSCHLENIPATADELNEIENLLKSGVIL